MKKLRQFVLVGLYLVVGTAFGVDYTLKSGVTDWTNPDSYEPTGNPGAGDTIRLPAETFEVDSSTASFGALSGVKRLVPSVGTKLVITVQSGEATLGCAFNADGETGGGATVGELVKRGRGQLNLGSPCWILNASGRACDYCTRLTLEEGELSLMQEPVEFSNRSHYGLIATSNSTVLVASVLPAKTGSMWAEVEWMGVCGTITNGHAAATRVFNVIGRASEGNSRINGTVDGKIRFWAGGNIDFNNDASTFSENVTATGWTDETKFSAGLMQVSKFGKQGDAASSLGTATSLTTHGGGGGFRYTGSEPDVTDKDISAFGNLFLDGGDFGGMMFSGKIYNQRDSASNEGQHRFVLYGANASAPCVFNGTVVANNDNAGVSEKDYSFYVVKRGSGTWRFEGNKNGGNAGWNGGLSVEEGTFQFDSIGAAGEDCSLGTALRLTDGQKGVWSSDHWVDYAIALGSAAPAALPTFEYVGSGPAGCTTRPIVLVGKGGALRAESGRLSLSGISARDPQSTPVLTLDGESTTGNEVREISAGAEGAKIGVTKTGSGTWKIGGNFSIGGDLKVSQGSLSLDVSKAPQPPSFHVYRWFRLSFAEIASTSGRQIQIRQIALFDKDGVRQNAQLTMPTAAFDNVSGTVCPARAEAGEVVYDPSMAGVVLGESGAPSSIARCFDDNYSGTAFDITLTTAPNKENRSTWFKIVMHLSDAANPVTHFDIQSLQKAYKNLPQRFVMEGSVNGRDWTELWSNVNDAEPHSYEESASYNRWISDGVVGAKGNRPEGTGFAIASGELTTDDEPFSWFRLSVAQIHNNASSLYMRQISLFDKFGDRQNIGLKLPSSVAVQSGVVRTLKAAEIAPGEAYYDASAAGHMIRATVHSTGTIPDLPAAFLNKATDDGVYHIEWKDAKGNPLAPTPDDQTTWIPIVMRLPPHAMTVSHFDLQALYYDRDGQASKQVPVRMKLEGSCDGEMWTEVWSNVEDDKDPVNNTLTGWNQWISDRGAGPEHFTVTKLYPDVVVYNQRLGGAVQVESGATLAASALLEIPSLRVDATGAGTLSGFYFGSSGTLDVIHAPKGAKCELPGTYVNCAGFENLAKWRVSMNGVERSGYRIKPTEDGKILITPPGLILMAR